jgi:predicted permease
MLNVGASLSRLEVSNNYSRHLFASIFTIRHIALPLLGYLLVYIYYFSPFALLSIAEDKMVGWVILLEFSVPMAQSILFLTLAYQGMEQYLTTAMVFSYGISALTLSVSITLGSIYLV